MAHAFQSPLRAMLHRPEGEGPHPTVVIAHGFKGFMGWGMFPWIADRLTDEGLSALRFDFSGNGVDAEGDFTDLEGFRNNTLGRELNDLDEVVGGIARGELDACRPERIGLLGHSRGGGGVILKAAADSRVAAVVTLAAFANPMRFPEEAVRTAEEQGYYEVLNARTGQMLPVGVEFFRDAATHDIPAAAAALDRPLLLIHGTADESVPVADARVLHEATGGRAEILEIEGAGHTFGAVHPFQGPTPHLEAAVSAAAAFFAKHLA